jgi:ribose/xylose/arabinose/galactoside ABC-type transport system permease subunit
VLGLGIIMVLRRGLLLANVSEGWQTIFVGGVLILTAVINETVARRGKSS